jgi:hypothetical protein
MKLTKKIFVSTLLIFFATAFQANAKTTYIYENVNNSNFHIHAVYDVPGGVRVAWFRVNPQKTLGYWRCGNYSRHLKCKEPNGIIQHFSYSGDKRSFYRGTSKFRLINKVVQ